MNEDEFLKLAVRYFNEQYDTPEEEIRDEQIIITHLESFKPKPKISDKIIDVTGIKKQYLYEKIKSYNNIQIGKFLVKMQRKNEKFIDVIIYEKIKNGILSKVDIIKDNRFKQTEWITYFNSFKSGHNVPEDKIIDIIRWLQVIENLSAFL